VTGRRPPAKEASQYREFVLAPGFGATRFVSTGEESFRVLRMPRLMEWLLWLVVPRHRDRTADLAADLLRLKGVVESSGEPGP
jgi:hypothetical protein